MRTFIPIIAVILFSAYTPISKKIITDIYPIILILYVRGMTLIFFFFFLGIYPELKRSIRESYHKRVPYMFFSLLAGAIGPAAFVFGLKYTSAINAALLVNSYSVFLLIASIVVFKEKLSSNRILGIAILFSGVLFIVFKGKFQLIQFNFGDLLILISQACFCVSDIIYKKYLKGVHSDVAILGRNLISFLFFGIISLFLTHELSNVFNHETFPYLIFLVLFPVLVAQFIWYKSVKITRAETLSRLRLLYPFSAVIIASILLGESLYVYHFIGGSLVIVGLIVSQLKTHPHFFHKFDHVRH